MATRGEVGERFAAHEKVEKTFVCEECRQPFVVLTLKNVAHRYGECCKEKVRLRRRRFASAKANAKRRAKANAKRRDKPMPKPPKPRLVRYAGYDPSERNR